jgi:flagellar assembly protein FliH
MTNLSSNTQFASGVQEFIYQMIPGSSGAPGISVDPRIFGQNGPIATPSHPVAGTPNITEIELKKREAAAFEQGMAAGRAEVQGEAALAVAEARKFVTDTLKGFEQERKTYYRRIEKDIVDLALAVARKVLHREAQVDRVVLAGVVRVALEKIAGATQVALHVHPTAVRAWHDYMAEQTVFATIPAVIEDGSLRPDQLVLKTDHGSTELGIDAQLKEIERGFSDLVQQKQRSLKQ